MVKLSPMIEYLEKTYEDIGKKNDYGLPDGTMRFIRENEFKTLLKDDNLCVSFINAVMENEEENKDDRLQLNNKERASHILITWLLGVRFGHVLKLDSLPFLNMSYNVIWLLTATTHDYGYFRSEIRKKSIPIENLTKKYSLLTDKYDDNDLSILNGMSHSGHKDLFSYSYDEIKNYYRYSIWYHENEHTKAPYKIDEKCDHGIVGGCIAFRKYCERNSQINKRMSEAGMSVHGSQLLHQIQKIACFTAASHNIFKSSNQESDNYYMRFGLNGLLSTSPKRITKANSLLTLLSLVDTVECSKRFSRKENRDSYFELDTILNCILVGDKCDTVFIDYKPLESKVNAKKEHTKESFRDHIKSVASLNNWTCIRAEKEPRYSDLAFKITIEGTIDETE